MNKPKKVSKVGGRKGFKAYIATIRVMVSADACQNSQAGACDYFSAMLSENADVIDWGYEPDRPSKNGGPCPKPQLVHAPEPYCEGDLFVRGGLTTLDDPTEIDG